MAYATRADLVDSPYRPASVTVPDDPEATRKLERASRRVDRLLLCAIYHVDEDGLPTDPDVVQALRDATCAQAAWWLETGDESGVTTRYTSVGIGSLTLTRGGRSGAAAGQADDDTTSPAAVEVLRMAGLLARGPISV